MTTPEVNSTIPNTPDPAPNGGTAAPNRDPLSDKETFLQLLVAQLRHQDPLSPADGTQFLAQLAQFTGLEKTIEIRDELKSINENLVKLQTAQNPTPAT